MEGGKILMTAEDLRRLEGIQAVAERRLRQREAGERLGLSVRQIRRWVQRYRAEGPSGLVCRYAGRRPGNAQSPQVRAQALAWVRKRYADFGPTLASVHLAREHGLVLSRETLR